MQNSYPPDVRSTNHESLNNSNGNEAGLCRTQQFRRFVAAPNFFLLRTALDPFRRALL